jgi:hypothetical protein
MPENTISYIGARLVEPVIELYKILEKMKFSGYSRLRVSMNYRRLKAAVSTKSSKPAS